MDRNRLITEKASGFVKKVIPIAAGMLLVGWFWSFAFPINKKIWTSSYVLVAGGWSALLLAAFYWMVDVRGWRRWASFFAVIGLNPLTIYLGQELIDFEKIAAFFVGGIAEHTGAVVGPLILAAGIMGVKWLMLWFLARKRIYLRI